MVEMTKKLRLILHRFFTDDPYAPVIRSVQMIFRHLIVVSLMLAVSATDCIRGGDGNERVDAFFKALASGNPDTFEAMAKEHYTPELLARRTPADRGRWSTHPRRLRATVARGVQKRNEGPVTLSVRGATGMQGTIELTLEAPPAERITRVAVR